MKTKKLKEDSVIAKAFEKLSKFMGDDRELLLTTYASNLVCSKELGNFILENFKVDDLPLEIKHYLALTWNLFAQVYMPDKLLEGQFDVDVQDYFESKSLDERFVCVVKQLYELCEKAKLL